MSRVITETRSKDYEPHKPTRHKRSFKPKLQGSPMKIYSTAPTCKKLFETSLALENYHGAYRALVDHDMLCSDKTSYPLKSSGGSDSRNVKRIKDDRHGTRSTNNPTAQTASLRASKDALGHTAEIVILNSTYKGSVPMTTTDSPNDFYPNTRTIFKELYELRHDYWDSETGSIEQTNDKTDVFFPMKSGDGDNPLEDCWSARRRTNLRDEPKWSSLEFARLFAAVCEYTVESLHSCNPKSNVPRRRSGDPRTIEGFSVVSLGKVPIRTGDVPDNTVEDIYMDNVFSDSLNVNMVLLDNVVTTDDEDYLLDSELSNAQDYP